MTLPLLLLCLSAQSPLTLEQIKAYPFPNELTAAGNRIAWAANEQGRRNIYVAEGPSYTARRITNYNNDDGQELTSVQISADGAWVVAVRGGEHGSNWDVTQPVNPASLPTPFRMQLLAVPFAGGEPKVLGEGDLPVISPKGDQVIFQRQGGLFVVPTNGSRPAKPLLTARGNLLQPQWSPDGQSVAFVSNRGTHWLVGVYSGDQQPILWIAPSTNRDTSPRWSPDGKQLAFIRMPSFGGEPRSLLNPPPMPWAIYTANATTGTASRIWASGNTRRDAVPTTHGQANLNWAAGDRIIFTSYADNWVHLYSIPATGGKPLQLTSGHFIHEHVQLSPDGKYIYSAANTGPSPLDIDRRHILRVPVDTAKPEVLTAGDGVEWTPAATNDGIVYISATAQRPPMVTLLRDNERRILAQEALPANYPTNQLVTPKQVTFKAPDGTLIYGQLFEPTTKSTGKRPGLVFVHGGPPRQMLLGWHYGDYYANAYATNQFLASRGYVVLSVNYRLGIGYGHDFHNAPQSGNRGAAEYQDVKAAGEYLRGLTQVEAGRIGIYGGSYGGYLTAMGLARDSKLFAAGVDIHGVHNRFIGRSRPAAETGYEQSPDSAQAKEVAWKSLPIADISTWKSPVLLIHGDDDRNVEFVQTVDLTHRLQKRGIPYEEIVIPDDTHHFLKHSNWIKIGEVTLDFFNRHLKP